MGGGTRRRCARKFHSDRDACRAARPAAANQGDTHRRDRTKRGSDTRDSRSFFLGDVRLRGAGQDNVRRAIGRVHRGARERRLATSGLRNRSTAAQPDLEPIMKPARLRRAFPLPGFERGVVLVVALIAMAAMGFSGMALIRLVHADHDDHRKHGVPPFGRVGARCSGGARRCRAFRAAPDRRSGLRRSCKSYYASRAAGEDARGVPAALAETRRYPDGAPIIDAGNGHSVRYVIERLCLGAGPPTPDNCTLIPATDTPLTTAGGAFVEPPRLPVFRQTIRVDGPAEATLFVQTWLADIPGRRRLSWRVIGDR